MKKNTRKSTALVTLVLVPLNLLGLGFTGCDSNDDQGGSFTDEGVSDESQLVDFDYSDPNDVFNLDPVTQYRPNPPVAYPATQPLGASSFSSLHSYGYYHHSYYHTGSHIIFLPMPYRVGYQPIYQPHPSTYMPFTGGRSSPSFSTYSRSSSYRSGSNFHSSSGTSRGGFGSTGHSMSSSGS